jgi:anti-sigma regulatory factor (Ser/Thr protein kinase)
LQDAHREVRHRHRFVAEPLATQAAARTLELLVADIGVDLVQRVQLLVTELIANAVTHAGMGGLGFVGLDVSITAGRVRVVVTDTGAGLEPGPAPIDPTVFQGRGLELLEQVSDRWGVLSRGRNRVWFEIDR